jgi:hypothetical protein
MGDLVESRRRQILRRIMVSIQKASLVATRSSHRELPSTFLFANNSNSTQLPPESRQSNIGSRTVELIHGAAVRRHESVDIAECSRSLRSLNRVEISCLYMTREFCWCSLRIIRKTSSAATDHLLPRGSEDQILILSLPYTGFL